MSSIKPLEMQMIVSVFERKGEAGYVLNFSNKTFSEFFAGEFDIAIDDPRYASDGTGKLKRLKCFLKVEDDAAAARVLRGLWAYRQDLGPNQFQVQAVSDGGAKLMALIERLEGGRPPSPPPSPPTNQERILGLKQRVLDLAGLAPQPRGFAFERFLKDAFDAFGLQARGAFRNTGEQIDGSFQLGAVTYLLEAKWQNGLTGVADLHVFQGKLEEKASWARGLFISVSGFSAEGLHAFGRGKKVICMDGRDLYEILDRGLALPEVIERKDRRAVETGTPFIPVSDLYV